MADDVHSGSGDGGRDPDWDAVERLLDEALPRPVVVTPSADEMEAAFRSVMARREPVASAPHPALPGVASLDRHRAHARPLALRAAAAILVAAGGALLWTTVARPRGSSAGTQLAANVPREYSTGVGQVDSLRLPDGTRVVLGPMSTLSLDARYGAAGRTVTLRGDGYFDVEHDATRPFVVHTAAAELRDVGTVFAVRSAPAQGVRVSVASGKVAAVPAGGSDSRAVMLGAGDRLVADRAGGMTVDRGAVTAEDLAWLQGHLVFRDAPLDYVATELRRWFGIDLRITDPAFRARHLTASFERGNASEVGRVLAAVLGGVSHSVGDTVWVGATPGARPQ